MLPENTHVGFGEDGIKSKCLRTDLQAESSIGSCEDKKDEQIEKK